MLTGSLLKLKSFDSMSLSDNSISGNCEYNAMNIEEEHFKLTFKPIACGSTCK